MRIGRAITCGIAAAVAGRPTTITTAPTGGTVTPSAAPARRRAPTWAPAGTTTAAPTAATANDHDGLIANHRGIGDAAATAGRAAATTAAAAGPTDRRPPTTSPTRASPAIRACGGSQQQRRPEGRRSKFEHGLIFTEVRDASPHFVYRLSQVVSIGISRNWSEGFLVNR